MAEPPRTNDHGPLGWEEQIFGPNPFASDDPRHGWWRDVAPWVTEADERLKAAILLRGQDGGDFSSCALDFYVGRFDIFATTLLVSSVRNLEDVARFKAALVECANRLLVDVQSMKVPAWVQKQSLVRDIRSKWSQRSAYWFAEALKAAREAEEQLAQIPVTSAPPPNLGALDEPPTSAGVFRRGANGDWELGFGTDRCGGVKHVEGMVLIRTLLAAPGQEFSAFELIVDGVMPVDARRTVNARSDEDGFTEDGLAITAQGSQWDGVPTLDHRALSEAKAELRELCEGRTRAEVDDNVEEYDRLEKQIEALTQQLSADVDLRGRPRPLGSESEKARKAAGRRYKTALKAVERSLPDLAKHLEECVKSGAHFRYLPDKPIHWTTEQDR